MKQAFLLAGAMTLAFVAAPAVAKPGNGHGKHGNHGQVYGSGYGNCPPGLAKKNNGCLPPGQAKKRFNRGDRYAYDYGSRYAYNNLPYDLRRQYDFDRDDNYYYDQGYLYQVDPKTMIVQQVIQALLR